MLSLDDIAVFVRVVEAGSFSAAAGRLAMPKATVSARIARLEKRLGLGLIQRTTRRLRVTEAGEQYFHHCVQAIREVEVAEAELQSTSGKPSGVLKITAPVDLGRTLLPRIVNAFASRYPDVSVELLVTNRVMDLVGEGIDLAIRPSQVLKDSSLIAQRYFDIGSNLWAAPHYLEHLGTLAHPRDLQTARLVGFLARGSAVLTNGKTDIEVPLQGHIRADDLETIKGLLLLGQGIGWLPDFLAAEGTPPGALVPVLPQWRPKERAAVYFVYAGRKYGLPKVRAFIETALELAPVSR